MEGTWRGAKRASFTAAAAALTLTSCALGPAVEADISRSVGASPPVTDTAPDDPTVAYLDRTFELFVGREPTEEDVERWRTAVELGDLEVVTKSLVRSEEWAAPKVVELYDTILGREPDDAGRDHWTSRLMRGMPPGTMAAHLYGSGEYLHRTGGTPEGFVDGLYRDVLGRPADDGGRAHLLGQLEAGVSRRAAATALIESRESRARRVQSTYRSVLERDADESGGRQWTSVKGALRDADVAATLAASGEFWAAATGDAPLSRAERGHATGFLPFATAGTVTLTHPAEVVDLLGFHQASGSRSLVQVATPDAVEHRVLPSRGRGTGATTAVDIVVPPDAEIRAPVTGTVEVAERYQLYCKSPDDRVFIIPDDDPRLRVKMLHMDGLQVAAGDRVEAGITPIAARSRVLPFGSQVDGFTADPPWPHVHVEVSDSVSPGPAASC